VHHVLFQGVILGHIVHSDGLLVDPLKIIAIITMSVLINVTEIKRFFGTSIFVANDVLPCVLILNYLKYDNNNNNIEII